MESNKPTHDQEYIVCISIKSEKIMKQNAKKRAEKEQAQKLKNMWAARRFSNLETIIEDVVWNLKNEVVEST